MPKEKHMYWALVPVMLSFMAMGFVDAAGVVTHYIKADFRLSDTVANLLPSMVFFWFLVFSVPAGMMMNKIGRRKTVLIGLILTAAALGLPFADYSFGGILASFVFLGLGNTLLQVALNPLLSNMVPDHKLAGVMAFGQFVKAIVSFLAPLIAGWAVVRFGSWKWLYLIFLTEAAAAFVFLSREKIQEEALSPSSFAGCFQLLGNGFILCCFLGIVCHVGIDVGINITAPRLLMERGGLDLTRAGCVPSVYFLFRTAGCLSGTFILARFAAKKFFWVSAGGVAAALCGLVVLRSQWMLYACIALAGFCNSNVFSIIFSQTMLRLPDKQHEISGLMITGLFGGAVFPFMLGLVADTVHSQTGAVSVLCAGALFLLWTGKKLFASME